MPLDSLINNGNTSGVHGVVVSGGYGSSRLSDTNGQLFELDMPVFTMDHAGHASRKSSSFFSLEQCEKDLGNILEHLSERYNFQTFTIIGNSFSSIPVARTAKKYNDLIKNIIYMSPVFSFDALENQYRILTNGDELDRKNITLQDMKILSGDVQFDAEKIREEFQFLASFRGIHPEILNTINSLREYRIYYNPKDRVINPSLIAKNLGNNAIIAESPSSDPLIHAIDIPKIRAGIREYILG